MRYTLPILTAFGTYALFILYFVSTVWNPMARPLFVTRAMTAIPTLSQSETTLHNLVSRSDTVTAKVTYVDNASKLNDEDAKQTKAQVQQLLDLVTAHKVEIDDGNTVPGVRREFVVRFEGWSQQKGVCYGKLDAPRSDMKGLTASLKTESNVLFYKIENGKTVVSQIQPVYFDTPATKLKAVVSGAFCSASNVEGRRTISRDVPKMIPEISLQDYLDHVWPSLPQSLGNQVDSILRILEDNATIDVPNDRWVAFPVDPANANREEGEVFQGLTTIFNAVTAAAKQIDSSLEQTFSLIIEGNVAMYSDRGASSRPDGFNTKDQKQTERKEAGDISKAKNKRYSVYDLANPHQFKLRDRQNDEDDILGRTGFWATRLRHGANSCLDPCRRFTFGTTIENRATRLWLLSRATLLRTKPFDFIKDRRQLVVVLLSLAFSAMNQTGWDPTIK
ncbi:hypothetical protein GGU11DRAFT_812417 [Lentinula aff. detonsa]|nr:hypothetical protein GGU11DRAFT_812417 [Lentinula aff. detonsa]